MSDQDLENKDNIEVLPNGVKVIWKFYKPKTEPSLKYDNKASSALESKKDNRSYQQKRTKSYSYSQKSESYSKQRAQYQKVFEAQGHNNSAKAKAKAKSSSYSKAHDKEPSSSYEKGANNKLKTTYQVASLSVNKATAYQVVNTNQVATKAALGHSLFNQAMANSSTIVNYQMCDNSFSPLVTIDKDSYNTKANASSYGAVNGTIYNKNYHNKSTCHNHYQIYNNQANNTQAVKQDIINKPYTKNYSNDSNLDSANHISTKIAYENQIASSEHTNSQSKKANASYDNQAVNNLSDNYEQKYEELSGLLERVTYHNEENGYCVLRLKVKGQTDLITLVGHTSSATPGEYVNALGFWIFNKEYGRQFKAHKIEVYPPTTLDGIERYLGSGMVKGVGPKTAKILVQAYGDKVFDIIEQDPNAMLDLHGIGKKRANKISSGWSDQKVIRSIMVFLHSHGVSTSKSVRIFKKYGANAIEVVQENPYCLAKDIRGIGFKSADTIAKQIGIGMQSPIRAQAGVAFALSQASGNDGHCCLPKDQLIKLTQELLEIPEPIIDEAILHELALSELIKSNFPVKDSIFLASLYHSEQRIAQSIKELLDESIPWPEIKEDIALQWVEKKLSLQLANSQKEAVAQALKSKVMVITGGPGVGKTTIVKAILTILAVKNVQIKLCAPTGRAAKRLSESSGFEATTIHRLLQIDPSTMEFKYNENNPIECDLLVVDECSMVDVALANNLLKAVPRHAALILVGDIDQLPSVGPGAFLSDLINCNCLQVIRLTEVFRQAASSWIVRIAHQINKGYYPTFPKRDDNGDCYFVAQEDREHLPQTLISLVQNRLPKAYGYDPIKDIQVLCPMNRGDSGARSLNMLLQKALNPPNENSITKFGITFSVGDKVMQIENNYEREVYNGDVGFVEDIDNQEQELIVAFDDRLVNYPFSELDELVLSYACTIHKSQGSEYPVVIIPLTMQHYMMLKRNLIYTGITRGKKLVVIVGEKKALNMAVKDWKTKERNSSLKYVIAQKLANNNDNLN